VEQAGQNITEATITALSDRFVLNRGQIQAAVQSAIDMRLFQHSSERLSPVASATTATPFSFYELARAAQVQSDQSLDGLASRVVASFDWGDLVLPPSTLRQVKEIAAAIKYRQVVYSQWGFEQRIAGGRGLKVLFAGPSGTGKTMTAGVIARDLGLELYKIDLSAIVSKYIGETEKNLDRIFRAARHSNAILFFDEADALFGKRSQVKDAHDRYANIEVAYLLQKMEEHEGVVILASNLSKNIDDAFSRRLHYIVDFPLPDEDHRALLWRGMFPARVPLSDDVDIPFLAKQFPLAGGDIRNVALGAAFAAAKDETAIAMQHLIRAIAQQMHRQGKATSPSDFKHHYALVAHDC
jgi:SpoVK/Ycf46/Vps4 family AAA+-type ATPase